MCGGVQERVELSPEQEAQRIAAVRRYDILDTKPRRPAQGLLVEPHATVSHPGRRATCRLFREGGEG
jgi:hypothetical protein